MPRDLVGDYQHFGKMYLPHLLREEYVDMSIFCIKKKYEISEAGSVSVFKYIESVPNQQIHHITLILINKH